MLGGEAQAKRRSNSWRLWRTGQRLWFLSRRERKTDLLPTEDFTVEEAEGGDGNVAGAPGESALDSQVEEISFNPFEVELVRRSVVIVGQSGDSGQVRLLSSGREAAQLHRIGHLVSK